MYQTLNVIGESRHLAERDILTRTAHAASEEVAEIRRAIGAAQALGVLSQDSVPSEGGCDATMKSFVEGYPAFDFAGYVSADGLTKCLSGPQPENLEAIHAELSQFPADEVNVNITGSDRHPEGVSLVTSVLLRDPSGAFQGTATIRIRHAKAVIRLSETEPSLHLALMDRHGDVLTASSELGLESFSTMALRPESLSIQTHGSTLELAKPLASGNVAAIVPVSDTGLYVVGLWQIDRPRDSASIFNATSILLPAVMWLASLSVAYFAIDQLVLRHLRALRMRMSRFSIDQSSGDAVDNFVHLRDAPAEIREIAKSYNAMVARITDDASKLEQNVAEKEILLKEVNHRVKNNLQLISSMLNMQLRTLSPGIAQSVMKRVQTRVMSLALVHRALYVTEEFKEVRVDEILRAIAETLIRPNIQGPDRVQLTCDLDPVLLDPDQAVPLCLTLTEALSNALASLTPAINIQLLEKTDGKVTLNASYTEKFNVDSTGDPSLEAFSERLIDALVTQLEGTKSAESSNGERTLSITFPKTETFGLSNTAAK